MAKDPNRKLPGIDVKVSKIDIKDGEDAALLLGLLAHHIADSIGEDASGGDAPASSHERGKDCNDPSCKLCTGGIPKYANLTLQQAKEHLKNTSYKPEVFDVVRLNSHGKANLKFPPGIETMMVLRVLDQPIYDTKDLFSERAGMAFNCYLGFKKTSGKIYELLYPSTCLELVERQGASD